MPTLLPLHTIDPAAVEALLDRAFGVDRHARTAYTVRGAAQPIAPMSFAAIEHGALVGSVQCWPVALALDAGGTAPLTMVGPVAVAPERQGEGIGHLLVCAALAAAQDASPGTGQMLIGDPEYYTRFGFTADRTARWRLPGPVEARRLLARGDVADAAGKLGPA